MNEESRTRNSMRNMSIGFTSQILNLVLNFISRTIFIRILGVEFLGINGLFSNILLILSLADLGIDSAMIFSLYKPLAMKDFALVNALVSFYRKVYLYIAAAISIVGLALVPFLNYLVNTEETIANLEIYYILFLLNSVVSYLFVYKTSVIEADQKNYLIRIYSIVFEIIKIIVQAAILILTQNYIFYLIITVIFTLLKNVALASRANKMYSYLKEPAEKIDDPTKKQIVSNVQSMFLYKIGGVLLNNTDNILISIMIGTVWVGYYSNYYLIIAGITSFTSVLFTSINSSVGNLIASSDEEQENNEIIYRGLTFVSFWIYGIGSICLFVLFNDFISLWLGPSFTLSTFTVMAIVLNFYIPGVLSSTTIYRNTTGLFRQTKYTFLITAVVNILLSVLLGNSYGVAGILFATVIARLATNFWYEPWMLYKTYFKKESYSYFMNQIVYFMIIMISMFLLTFISQLFPNPNIASFLIQAIGYFIVLNSVFYVLFKKTIEMKFLLSKVNPLFVKVQKIFQKS